ncbi:MAG: hypothetical protein KAG45_00795 [Methyloprofundus sp.]|nr:hypothetical protein [Methyloprofundus sp.]
MHLLLITCLRKAPSQKYTCFFIRITPYDMPEIIAFPIENGLPDYLQ